MKSVEQELIARMEQVVKGLPAGEWRAALMKAYPFGLKVTWSYSAWIRLLDLFIEERYKAAQLRRGFRA